MAEPVAQEDRQAPGDLVGGLPADERPASRRLRQPVALDPRIGPRHRDGLEAAGHQADRRRLRQPLVRRRHDARDPQPRPPLEPGHAVQGVVGPARRRSRVPQPAQLRTVMQPAVNEQRQPAVVAAEDPARTRVGEPAVERSRRHRDVVPVPLGVPGQLGEVDVAVVGQWRLGSSRMNAARSGGGDQRAPEHTPRRKCTSARRPRQRPGTRRWRNVSWAASSHGAIATRSHRPTPRAQSTSSPRRAMGIAGPVSRSGATVAAGPSVSVAPQSRASSPAPGSSRTGTGRPPPARSSAVGVEARPARRRRCLDADANEPVEPVGISRLARLEAHRKRALERREQPRARGERRRRNDADHRRGGSRRGVHSRSAAAGGRRCAAGCRGAAACRSGRRVRPGCRAPSSAARPSA